MAIISVTYNMVPKRYNREVRGCQTQANLLARRVIKLVVTVFVTAV